MTWLKNPPEQLEPILKKVESILIKNPEEEQVVFWFSEIDKSAVLRFYLKRKEILGKEKIILVIDSPGGDIDAAYSLIEIIRSHCKSLEVVVPLWAKSAATLVCLAANKIFLTTIAELGPLDTQVWEPKEVCYKGALDEYQAIMQIRQEAFSSFDHAVQMILARTGGMQIPDILGPACQFVASLVSPLYYQIDPTILGRRARQLDTGLQYAYRVLKRFHKYDDKTIKVLVDKLVYRYPSHSFVINYNEAKSLSLPVELIEHDELDKLIPFLAAGLYQNRLIGSFLNEMKENHHEIFCIDCGLDLKDNTVAEKECAVSVEESCNGNNHERKEENEDAHGN